MYLNSTETYKLRSIIAQNGLNYRAAAGLVSFFRHIEKHRGIKALVTWMKTAANNMKHGKLVLRGGAKLLSQLLKRGRRGRRYFLNICALHGRWEAKPAKEKDFALFCTAVKPEANRIPGLLKLNDEDLQILKDAICLAHFSFNPLNSNTTHILMGNRSSVIPSLPEELLALTEAGALYIEFEDLINEVFEVPESARMQLHSMARVREDEKSCFVGRVVALTKDRSLKLRFIANLMKGWQVLISPMVFVLKEFIRRQEMSALFNQIAAVDWMVQELKQGKKITSVDLVQATDFLPRYLSEDTLMSVLLEVSSLPKSSMFIQAFLLDCRLNEASYWTPFDNIVIEYGTGQAMGRWTSKYLLDFTMILLAKYVGGSSSNCRINGDDVFFSDTQVALRFIHLLKSLNIPISDTKTFIDKDFGEFSGMIADRYGSLEVFKASLHDVRKDPFGPLRRYGPSGINLLPKRLQPMIWALASLPAPYGIDKVRQLTQNPFSGFDPPLPKRKIRKFSWENEWVEQAFLKHSIRLLQQRAAKLANLLASGLIHEMDQEDVAQRHSNVLRELFQKQGQVPFAGLTRRHFKQPLQRLDLFADHLNSSTVKTSDGWRIKGYGDTNGTLTLFRNKAMTEFPQGISRDEFGVKEEKPKLPLSWAFKVWGSLQRFIVRYIAR